MCKPTGTAKTATLQPASAAAKTTPAYLGFLPGRTPKHSPNYNGKQMQALKYEQGSKMLLCTGHLHNHNADLFTPEHCQASKQARLHVCS